MSDDGDSCFHGSDDSCDGDGGDVAGEHQLCPWCCTIITIRVLILLYSQLIWPIFTLSVTSVVPSLGNCPRELSCSPGDGGGGSYGGCVTVMVIIVIVVIVMMVVVVVWCLC